jgi:hypothetical protein
MRTKLVLSTVAAFSIVLALALLLARATLAAGGTGPADAFFPLGQPLTAAPNSQTWFKFDESGSGLDATVELDAGGQQGLAFGVATPEAIVRWAAGEKLQFVGAGSRDPVHDLVWRGRLSIPGTYYVVVTNNASVPITYRLRAYGDGVTTVVERPPTATPFPNPFKTVVPVGRLTTGKIAFQESSGGSIYTVNADGTNLQRITFGLDPAFSPDGTRIAFARQGPVPGLYVIDANGANERALFGGTQVRSPSWTGDGTRIVFSTVTSVRASQPFCFFGRCFGGEDQVRWQLKAYDLTADALVDVIQPPTGGMVPSVNWKNGAIAFMNPEKGLMLTSLDGNPSDLIAGAHDDMAAQLINDDLSINTPAMAPDGARLTYMVRQPPVSQVVVSVWDGTHATLLTRIDPLDFVHANNVAPSWSPDGQEILFLSDRSGRWEFFAIRFDGADERQVLKNITDALDLRYNYSAERVASWAK